MHSSEVSCFEEILGHLALSSSEETFVVFDVDDTLLRSTQQLGSVAWFDYIKANFERKGVSKKEAQEIVSILWVTVQPYMKVEAVDPNTQKVIQEIQSKKFPVISLTARKPEEAYYTRKQLQSIGIDLSLNGLITESRQEFSLQHTAIYDRGILFANHGNKKSDVLLSFLQKNTLKPKRILFVDDFPGHVEDVKEALKAVNIECIGLRFSGSDLHVKKFDSKIADIQWEKFPHLLSDKEAQDILADL